MPGGPGGGGVGGFAGMLMRNIAGGGPGGGMGGPGGGMGGMGMNRPNDGGQNTGFSSDVYDVDRWKRSDDLDSGYSPTMVQTVRDAWEQETQDKRMRSLLMRIRTRFQRKNNGESPRSIRKRERRMERRAKGFRGKRDDYEKDRSYENAAVERETERDHTTNADGLNRIYSSGGERPRGTLEGNTIITPEMRKASHHVPDVLAKDGRIDEHSLKTTGKNLHRKAERSPIGLTTRAGIDSFFSSSPLNSTLLAVDSLSFGPLTLNQVRQKEVLIHTPAGQLSGEHAHTELGSLDHNDLTAGTAEKDSLSGKVVQPAGSGINNNLITKRAGTSYMDALREDREFRKYDVRIRNH